MRASCGGGGSSGDGARRPSSSVAVRSRDPCRVVVEIVHMVELSGFTPAHPTGR
jgi:hypothetical protein